MFSTQWRWSWRNVLNAAVFFLLLPLMLIRGTWKVSVPLILLAAGFFFWTYLA